MHAHSFVWVACVARSCSSQRLTVVQRKSKENKALAHSWLQEEAARTLGANDWQVFWNVTLPNIRWVRGADGMWDERYGHILVRYTKKKQKKLFKSHKKARMKVNDGTMCCLVVLVRAQLAGGSPSLQSQFLQAGLWVNEAELLSVDQHFEQEVCLLLDAHRWALLYGTILTNARAMGEFGAVSVISGNILGKTQTLTLFVESAYKVRNRIGAHSIVGILKEGKFCHCLVGRLSVVVGGCLNIISCHNPFFAEPPFRLELSGEAFHFSC